MISRFFRKLLSSAVTIILILGLMSTSIIARNKSIRGQFYQGVGLIKKVIAESLDSSVNQESWMFQERVNGQLGKMLPLVAYNNVNLENYLNLEVTLRGRRINGSLVINSLATSEKLRLPRVLHPERLPRGESNYNLSDLRQAQQFQELVSTEAMVLPSATVGERMLVVAPIHFSNNTNTRLTHDELVSRFTTGSMSVRGYFQEASFRLFSTQTLVLETIVLPFTDQECAANLFGTCTQAVLAQIPPEITAQSHNYIFMPPVISGTQGAISTLGTKGQNLTNEYAWIQQYSLFDSDVKSFLSAVTHELGHQLGLQHAEGISLSGVVCGSCDRADTMTARLRYPNAYHRMTLGWFKGKITVLNGPGTYNVILRSPAVVANKLASRVVLVPQYNLDNTPTGEMMLWEIRAEVNPYESFVLFPNYRTGLAKRKGSMDLSLSSSRPYLYHLRDPNPVNYDNAPLPQGEVFTDTSDGTSIEYFVFMMAVGGKARITVTRGP